MPGATWRPIPVNYTNGGQASVRGVVVHIMAGTLSGTDSWFRNPRARASSHFGAGKSGALYQWVDTSDRAWAQASGNSNWLSVENEGKGGDRLTDDQLDANARVLAWAHDRYGVPLKVASSTSDRGLAYHALGGSAWGGHTSCPGSRIVAQLPEIVDRAARLAGGNTHQEDNDMQLDDAVKLGAWVQKTFPKQKGLQDGEISVRTALGSGYAYAHIAADNSTAILAQLGAQAATIEKLADALGGGGLTAAEIRAAAEAGAQAALNRLGSALTTPED
ncbi:peptidoglycan recognition family protein [Streptomyces sp. 891-h]|uniref:N-acetylmuramoyl-L-alanine amidase n=1 Tax=Streptomyces sp. 891-h TaxID=2720714 RepID=UPI001FAA0E4A|nr:peptidoglycan recognition family protein [Streptomyces sp. 891-h]